MIQTPEHRHAGWHPLRKGSKGQGAHMTPVFLTPPPLPTSSQSVSFLGHIGKRMWRGEGAVPSQAFSGHLAVGS